MNGGHAFGKRGEDKSVVVRCYCGYGGLRAGDQVFLQYLRVWVCVRRPHAERKICRDRAARLARPLRGDGELRGVIVAAQHRGGGAPAGGVNEIAVFQQLVDSHAVDRAQPPRKQLDGLLAARHGILGEQRFAGDYAVACQAVRRADGQRVAFAGRRRVALRPTVKHA